MYVQKQCLEICTPALLLLDSEGCRYDGPAPFCILLTLQLHLRSVFADEKKNNKTVENLYIVASSILFDNNLVARHVR